VRKLELGWTPQAGRSALAAAVVEARFTVNPIEPTISKSGHEDIAS